MSLQSGALPDQRPQIEINKDFKQAEVVAAGSTPLWTEKPQSTWRSFPLFNQNGSGSCVAQTEAKEIGIMRYLKDGQYVHFSATDIYQRRNNKPAAGMGANNAREILRKGGATLEVLTPSQMLSDAEMDTAVVENYKREVGNIFKVPNYLEIQTKDIDSVAATIQATKKGVMVWFYFTAKEWTERPSLIETSLDLYGSTTIRHSVCAVDFTLINGVKHLIIEDSWTPGTGKGGQRAISETFFKERNWYASYLINFIFDDFSTPKPKYEFKNDLEYGMTNNEVRILQDCLKWLALFPTNSDSTGYFGAITKKAVQNFQESYGISPSGSSPGRVGPATRAKLNKIFS